MLKIPDAGDSIILFEWDIDGNGTYDVSSTSATTTVSWATLQSLGITTNTSYPLTLRVTDSFGASASVTTARRVRSADI